MKNFFLKIFTCFKKIGIKLKNGFKNFLQKIKRRKNVKKETNKEKKKRSKEVIKENKKEKSKKKTFEEIYPEKVKEKVLTLKSLTGKPLPITLNKADKKRRKTIYLKEALLFTIILTLIDILGFYKTRYIDYLRIFDNNIWNLVATICLTLLVLFIASFLLDLIITETILKINRKKLSKQKKKTENKQDD